MITYQLQNNPNIVEYTNFIEKAFNVLMPEDQESFDKEGNGQSLSEWFDINQITEYLGYSFLIEARDEVNKLVGLVMCGKQNPLSWPDGNKVEMFVLAVDAEYRGQGIGSKLVKEAELTSKNMGAKKIILNTHILLTADHKFYEKLGFIRMGILKDYYGNGDAVFYFKDLK